MLSLIELSTKISVGLFTCADITSSKRRLSARRPTFSEIHL